FVFIIAMLIAGAAVCVIATCVREGPCGAAGHARSVERVRRAGAIALVVGAVCWLQPVLQQFVGDAPGNITRLWRAGRHPTPTIGFNLGVRLTADVVTMPPGSPGPSFHDFLAT